MEMVQNALNDRIILHHRKVRWPARSPDLTPHDFFLWSTLKLRIKAGKPRTIYELKQYLGEEIEVINNNKALLTSIFDNFKKRLHVCVRSGGSHILL